MGRVTPTDPQLLPNGPYASRRTAMKATSITWRRTFPDSAPGTDGVASGCSSAPRPFSVT